MDSTILMINLYPEHGIQESAKVLRNRCACYYSWRRFLLRVDIVLLIPDLRGTS